MILIYRNLVHLFVVRKRENDRKITLHTGKEEESVKELTRRAMVVHCTLLRLISNHKFRF
jgi:hypothetical protein